jgi:hypothetical protein
MPSAQLQSDLFAISEALPHGLVYQPDFLTREEEAGAALGLRHAGRNPLALAAPYTADEGAALLHHLSHALPAQGRALELRPGAPT